MSAPIQIEKMTLKEKLQTMEALWEDLCKRENQVPVPSWHESVLEERERSIDAGKARFSSWETARKRLSKKMS